MLTRQSHKEYKITPKIKKLLGDKGYGLEYEKTLLQYFLTYKNQYIYMDPQGCLQLKGRDFRTYCMSSENKEEAIQMLYEAFLFSPEIIKLK